MKERKIRKRRLRTVLLTNEQISKVIYGEMITLSLTPIYVRTIYGKKKRGHT